VGDYAAVAGGQCLGHSRALAASPPRTIRAKKRLNPRARSNKHCLVSDPQGGFAAPPKSLCEILVDSYFFGAYVAAKVCPQASSSNGGLMCVRVFLADDADVMRKAIRLHRLDFGENAHTFFICRCDSLQKSWAACTGSVRIEKQMNQCGRNNGSFGRH
jgi:hypothetical protein